MRLTSKLLFCVVMLLILSGNPVITSIALWEIYYTPEGNFQLHYVPHGNGFPEHEVSLSQVEIFGALIEEVREKVLQYNFDNPERNSRTWIGIQDQNGINARGGIQAGHGKMTFDPFFLGEADVNLGRSASIQEQFAIAAHEYLHVIQFMYPGSVGPPWVYEGQARMLQDKIYSLCDQDETFGWANYYGEVQGYLQNPIRNLFQDGAYDLALFWNYVTEQFGNLQTEPGRGVDALYEFWEAAQAAGGCTDAFYIFEKMLERLGYQTWDLMEVFTSFVVANYAKDLEWGQSPSSYRYMDELQTPGKYASVPLEIDKILPYGGTETNNDMIPTPWSPKYYRIIPVVRGARSPIIVDVSQITNEDLFIKLLVINNNMLKGHYTQKRVQHFSQSVVVEPGDELVLIISTLEDTDVNGVDYHYSFASTGPGLSVNIQSPRSKVQNLEAYVGPYYDPGKLQIITEILSYLQPVPNIHKDDFQVKIGGLDAHITSCTNVYGLYYLEVEAPIQPSWNVYNLTVTYGNAMDQEDTAVAYDLRTPDNMLVIDKSGSMGWDEKIDAALAAARLFVNSFYNSCQVGVVSFDGDATILADLKPVEQTRNFLISQIDSIIPIGGTSIGDGLFVAQNEIFLYGNTTFVDDHIIILTDGEETDARYIADVAELIKNNNTQVHVILLGVDTEAAELQELAYSTGGSIHFAFDPASGTLASDLAGIYRFIAEQTTNEQRVFSHSAVLNDTNWNIEEAIYLDPAKKATIVLNYKADSPFVGQPVVVQTPGGTNISATFVTGKQGSTDYYGHYVWILEKPDKGTYKIIVEQGSGNIEYFAEASLEGRISLNHYFPLPDRRSLKEPSQRVTGCEFPILVSLADNDPILDASIFATITTGTSYTDTESWILKLYDDGHHGDGLPADGVYGNWFTRTMKPGTYSVKIQSTGYSSIVGNFTREANEAFHLIPDEDIDKDGLPDGWESRFGMSLGTAIGQDGAKGDQDLDGLENLAELMYGTSPIKADTDRGGESDSSEVNSNRDSYFMEDDNLVPPNFLAIPGNQNVTVRFQARPGVVSFKLYRADDNNKSFTLVNDLIDASTHEFIDSGLINGRVYYYRMVAVNTEGVESGFSPIISATPNTDTIRPTAFVFINNGDNYTNNPTITLRMITNETDITHLRVSQTSSFDGVPWLPFQDTLMFTLSGLGIQFVFVEFRDSLGNIGGDDRGVYAYDGIIVDPNYEPPNPSSTSKTKTSGLNFNFVAIGILILPLVLYRKKKRTE
ncbi:MAG: VWA domain-containing protein [Candidatus Hodarchaeales archaeon]